MGITWRRPIDLGFVRLNFTLRGLSSYTIRPIPGLVSWNSYTRRWSWNLSGRWKYTTKPTPR
jgi:hypothetical protein